MYCIVGFELECVFSDRFFLQILLQVPRSRSRSRDLSAKAKVLVSSCYPRDAMLARVIGIATCLSVCPSVTRRYCVKMKKASVMISAPSGSLKILVF